MMSKILLPWLALLCLARAAPLPTQEEIDAVRAEVKDLMADEVAAMEHGEKTAEEVADSCCSIALADERTAYRLLLFRAAFRLYMKKGMYERAVGVFSSMRESFGNSFLIPAQGWLRPHERQLNEAGQSDAVKKLLACLHGKLPPQEMAVSGQQPLAQMQTEEDRGTK